MMKIRRRLTLLDALGVSGAGQTVRVAEGRQVTSSLLGHTNVVLAEQYVPLIFSLHVSVFVLIACWAQNGDDFNIPKL